jgi:hypothetical protein
VQVSPSTVGFSPGTCPAAARRLGLGDCANYNARQEQHSCQRNKHPLAPSTHHRFRVPIPSARGQKQYTLYGIINLCTMQYFKCWLLPCAF